MEGETWPYAKGNVRLTRLMNVKERTKIDFGGGGNAVGVVGALADPPGVSGVKRPESRPVPDEFN